MGYEALLGRRHMQNMWYINHGMSRVVEYILPHQNLVVWARLRPFPSPLW